MLVAVFVRVVLSLIVCGCLVLLVVDIVVRCRLLSFWCRCWCMLLFFVLGFVCGSLFVAVCGRCVLMLSV